MGGHAPGLQVVVVQTAGGPVVLASDASHFYANLQEDRPFAIVHSLPGMFGAFDRLRELAGGDDDRIVPGHDPLVLERFAPPTPELAGRAVEITVRRGLAPNRSPPGEHAIKVPSSCPGPGSSSSRRRSRTACSRLTARPAASS